MHATSQLMFYIIAIDRLVYRYVCRSYRSIQLALGLTSYNCINHASVTSRHVRKVHTSARVYARITRDYLTEADQVDNDSPGWTQNPSLNSRDICCGLLWAWPPLYQRIPWSTVRFIHPRIDTDSVATIVQLASRRGIISAHCRRLIEFCCHWPSRSRGAFRTYILAEQRSNVIRAERWYPAGGCDISAFVKGQCLLRAFNPPRAIPNGEIWRALTRSDSIVNGGI